MKGNIAKIETMGLLDGPGVRVVVFFQGCPLRCLFCHNPEMWKCNSEKGMYLPNELTTFIQKYQPYFGTNGGVTFSGGEPLFQSEFLLETLKLCKKNNIHTALDTSGAIINEYTADILDNVDLVILDIKAVDNKGYLNITGVSINKFNQFLELLINKKKKLWLRSVIVPGINDNVEYISNLASFIKNIPNVEQVDLLPYSTIGSTKYEELGIVNSLEKTKEMDIDKCNNLAENLKKIMYQQI